MKTIGRRVCIQGKGREKKDPGLEKYRLRIPFLGSLFLHFLIFFYWRGFDTVFFQVQSTCKSERKMLVLVGAFTLG